MGLASVLLLGILIYWSRLTLEILKSDCVEVPPLVRTTAESISILACISSKDTALLTVVVAPLVLPVIVSPELNVPDGTVIAKLVLEGLLVIKAVALLVPPVIVSPLWKVPVIVPIGNAGAVASVLASAAS